jgi:hypothetical protein
VLGEIRGSGLYVGVDTPDGATGAVLAQPND